MSVPRHRLLGWKTKKAAEQRYGEIVSLVDFNGKRVLDVGCGFGDIIPFIRKAAKNFEYTGIDKASEFVKVAKELYPQQEFIIGDYFLRPLKRRFDVVIACGSLNSNRKNNLEFRKKAIRILFGHTKEALFFNMTGRYPQPKTAKRSNVWFADPRQILEYCLTLTPKIVFINHPGRSEFSLILRK
jgi:SAM-dependent methyltransferase